MTRRRWTIREVKALHARYMGSALVTLQMLADELGITRAAVSKLFKRARLERKGQAAQTGEKALKSRAIEARARRAWEMRRAGLRDREIAGVLGVSKRALEDTYQHLEPIGLPWRRRDLRAMGVESVRSPADPGLCRMGYCDRLPAAGCRGLCRPCAQRARRAGLMDAIGEPRRKGGRPTDDEMGNHRPQCQAEGKPAKSARDVDGSSIHRL